MGKVKWGGGISQDAIDEVDTSKQFTPYDGPVPPAGVYRMKVKILRTSESSNGNPQLVIGLELVPRSDIPEQRRYKGFFLMDWITVLDSTAWRLRPFLDAVGVTSKEFLNGTVQDEEKNVTKIGKKVVVGSLVAVSIKNGQDQKGNARMEVGQYMPVVDADDTADPDADDASGSDDEPPF